MNIGPRYNLYEDKLGGVTQHCRDINDKVFIFTQAGPTILCSEIQFHQETVQRHLIKEAL